MPIEPAIKSITHKVILINIARRFKDARTPQELYEYTRGLWRIGPKRDLAEYVFSVYKGRVITVYKPTGPWLPARTTKYEVRKFEPGNEQGRWEFEGIEAEKDILDCYVGMNVGKGSQNPIRYVNF
jgi:hypothetical protein